MLRDRLRSFDAEEARTDKERATPHASQDATPPPNGTEVPYSQESSTVRPAASLVRVRYEIYLMEVSDLPNVTIKYGTRETIRGRGKTGTPRNTCDNVWCFLRNIVVLTYARRRDESFDICLLMIRSSVLVTALYKQLRVSINY